MINISPFSTLLLKGVFSLCFDVTFQVSQHVLVHSSSFLFTHFISHQACSLSVTASSFWSAEQEWVHVHRKNTFKIYEGQSSLLEGNPIFWLRIFTMQSKISQLNFMQKMFIFSWSLFKYSYLLFHLFFFFLL